MNINQLTVYQQNMRLQAQVGDMVLHMETNDPQDVEVRSPRLLSFIESSVYRDGP